MIIMNSFFFIGTVTLVLCINCVYSLYIPINYQFIKNTNKNYNHTNCSNILLIPSQKIIFLNSKREIDVYRNYLDNDIFILKSDDSNICIKFKNSNYTQSDYLENCEIINSIHSDVLNKKIIKISPAGLNGFYDAGICSIIKKNYNLDKYIFSGASAGAWNSLFMSYKNDVDNFIKNILEIDVNFRSIKHIQMDLKDKILKSHKTEEFDLKKVFISVCVYNDFQFKNYIYTDFVDLEDAIDCCIASSNIPFLTGNLIHKYRNKITFDGGFLYHQTFLFAKPSFKINYGIWGRKKFFTSLLNNANKDIHKTYYEGVIDSESNIKTLDNKFLNF
jgi:hypothetical protein